VNRVPASQVLLLLHQEADKRGDNRLRIKAVTLRLWVYRGHITRGPGGYDLREILDYLDSRENTVPEIDASALAYLIAQDSINAVARTGFDLSDVPNQPTLAVLPLDADAKQVSAAVLVDLGGGYMTHLTLRKILAAGLDVEAQHVRRDDGCHELRLVDSTGQLYGLAMAAPQPKLDDEVPRG
jgi:hypothetical protein